MDTARRKYKLHDGQSGAALTIRVTPRSSRDEVSDIQEDGTVKIRLKASGPDENINQALLKFLSDLLGVQTGKLEIVAGDSGMDKLVTVMGIDAGQLQKRILRSLGAGN